MLIAVDKPLELSSFDIVKRMKHVFPGQKIGHSGTLDPKATGLMVLGIGKGTKRLTALIGLDKVYETVIDFSKMSDTWDLGYRENYEEYPLSLPSFGLSPCKGDPAVLRGRVKGGRGDFEQVKGIIVNHTEIPAPTREAIEAKFKSLLPSHELPLPAFSAKKKDGKRLYQLARSGKEISESRVMKVHSFEILEYAFPRLRVRLAVGSGTYIRSIGYWLGQEFGLGGILTELRRISLGEWSLEKLVLPEEVEYHMRGQIGVMKWRVISN